MTCGHCSASVTEELTALPGVTAVAVDLHPGEDSPVTITSEAPSTRPPSRPPSPRRATASDERTSPTTAGSAEEVRLAISG